MSSKLKPRPANTGLLANPWIQLTIGVICMACVANLQYGWTLFVNPIDAKYHWGRPAIQLAFTLFVLLETWLIPVEGYLVDRFGPRYVVIGGAFLVTLSWLVNSVASSLPILYLGAALGGIGTGCVYGTCVGNALKWFPGRRGLAAGITAAGFGAGAALTIGPISAMISSAGYSHAFFVFALIQGGIVFVMAWAMLAAPASVQAATLKPDQTTRGYTPGDVEQERARSVRRVGHVVTPGRQARYQPAVDCAGCGARRAIDMLDRPGQLGCREVGVQHQAGDLADSRLMAGGAELVAGSSRAAVLPDDRWADGLERAAVPEDEGFALVGDADRLHVGG